MPKEPKESRVSRFECALQLANETIKARDAEIIKLRNRNEELEQTIKRLTTMNCEFQVLQDQNRNLDIKNELLIDEIRNLEEQLQR